jgi:hypothetical protein
MNEFQVSDLKHQYLEHYLTFVTHHNSTEYQAVLKRRLRNTL